MSHTERHKTNGMSYGHDKDGKRVCTGAKLGRPDIYHPGNNAEPTKPKPRFYLRRVRLNSGGYDSGGAYWGMGRPLYEYESEDYGEHLVSGFIRADDRDDAIEQIQHKFPSAVFYGRAAGRKAANWFDEHGWLLKPLPKQCVRDCGASGGVDDAVEYWVNKLAFDMPEDKAAEYLQEYGAWDAAELRDHQANRRRILWLACCDIREQGEWLGLVH